VNAVMKIEPGYLSAAVVQRRFGVSRATLWNWLRNPALAFPRPLKINGRNYFDIGAIVAWEETRASCCMDQIEIEALQFWISFVAREIAARGGIIPPASIVDDMLEEFASGRIADNLVGIGLTPAQWEAANVVRQPIYESVGRTVAAALNCGGRSAPASRPTR